MGDIINLHDDFPIDFNSDVGRQFVTDATRAADTH
jgi:hypothetical protein